jgi:hypothetical protein
MGAFWKALKENPVETAMLSVGVALGLVLGFFTILGRFKVDLAIGVSMEILAIIAVILFFIRGKTDQVERAAQDTTMQLQHLECTLEEIRLHSWRLSEIFDTFGEKIPELEGDFKNADQVWILSRTCRRLWTDFRDELVPLVQKGKLRLLLLDPEGCALGLTAKSAIWDRPEEGNRVRSDVAHFLEGLEAFSQQNGLGRFVRKIDYLPPWTLILVNPGGEGGVINGGKVYVEMATYRAHPRKRPCFTILSDKDYDLFSEFRDEYSKMWDEAKDAWGPSG